MLTATFIAAPTSAAIVVYTFPASPSLTIPRLETRGQSMAARPVRLLLELLRLDEDSLQFNLLE